MPLQFDRSWDALLNPGKATDYFAADIPAFDAAADGWTAANGCWMAELCRTIYRNDDRSTFLRRAELEEAFVDRAGTQCGVVHRPDAFAVLVFRGTSQLRNWLTNLHAVPIDWPRGGRVHRGFATAWQAVAEAALAVLEDLALPTFYTGHSLGAALALLAASQRPPRATYSFGGPRVGDAGFVATLPDRVHRIVNRRDPVPSTPPPLPGWEFVHGGECIHLEDSGITHDDGDWEAPALQLEQLETGKRWFDPHESLSDHAPRNYVAALQRLL